MNMMDYKRLANRLSETTDYDINQSAELITGLRKLNKTYKEIEDLIEQGRVSMEYVKELNLLVSRSEEFEPMYKKDNINPSHYKRYNLEMIENIQNMSTPEEFKGYLKGNIIKYLARYQGKGGLEDLKKCEWYQTKLYEVVSDDGQQDK